MNSIKILILIATLLFSDFSGCLLSQTPGTKKWEFQTGNWIPSSPAIGADGTVYVGSFDSKLYAINPDGTKKWEFVTKNYIYSSSPAIGTDGTVYIGSTDNRLYAINPDGTKKWEFVTGNAINSSPAIGADGTVYIGSDDSKLYAINPDGTKKWGFVTGAPIRSSPAIGIDGTIYAGSGDSKLYAIKPDGTKKWEFVTGDYVDSSPAIGTDGTIYFSSSDYKLYSVNPDGTKKWAFEIGNYSDSPVIGADGTIYIGSYNSKLYAINPNGTKKWEFLTGDNIFVSPAIGNDGTIYFGSNDTKFYAINPEGTKKWEFVTGTSISSSPAIGTDGIIYFGSSDYKLYALYSTSLGLANSSWPKDRSNNYNRGRPGGLVVSQTDFSNMTLPNVDYSFNVYLNNAYDNNITITGIHFNDIDFGKVTTLPITIAPETKQEISLVLTNPQNKWYKPKLFIDFNIDGYNKAVLVNIQGVIFIDDNSELSFTAKRVMQVWKSLDRSNEILFNNTKGLINRLLFDYSEAEKCFILAENLALNKRFGYDGVMMNLGVVKSDKAIPDSADFFYASALLDITKSAAVSVLAPQIYYNQAWEEYTKTNYESAAVLALKTINHSMSNAYLKAKAYCLLGAIRYFQDNTGEAKNAFLAAYNLDLSGPIGKMAQENLAEINSTSIDQIDISTVRIYPNPSDGNLTVTTGDIEGRLEFDVFSNMGSLVFSDRFEVLPFSSYNVNLSTLSNGIYFAHIKTGKLVLTERLIIIR
jgi:outer membrane protein assembly factor BamB